MSITTTRESSIEDTSGDGFTEVRIKLCGEVLTITQDNRHVYLTLPMLKEALKDIRILIKLNGSK